MPRQGRNLAMEHSFHYLLLANQSMVHRAAAGAAEGYRADAGPAQGAGLSAGSRRGPSGRDRRACHIEPASLTSVLNRMEEKALVERRTQQGDPAQLCGLSHRTGPADGRRVQQAFAQLEEQAFAGDERSGAGAVPCGVPPRLRQSERGGTLIFYGKSKTVSGVFVRAVH